jgi:hypothetical protein
MIEILVLMFLTGHVARIVGPKGRSVGGFKLLTALLWFGGEAVGALVGATFVGHETVDIYGPALIGAALGAVGAVAIAKNAKLSGLEMAERNFAPPPTGENTGFQTIAAKCTFCNGTGSITCWSCQGKGRTGGVLGIGAKSCVVCSGRGVEGCANCVGKERNQA